MSTGFYIVKVVPGSEPEPVPSAGKFESSQEAAGVAKDLTLRTGVKHQPRRMAQADTESWKERERKRATDGTYKTLPAGWAALPFPENHFTHISPKNQAMVAFFANLEAGILDKATEMLPGRYLAAHFKDMDPTGEAFKALIAEIDALSGVQFARTREEMKQVYENGPTSCMAHKASHWPYKGVHPAEMYAGGDLAVAYLVDEKQKSFKATARVVCWPERKLYGRLYGDGNRLAKLLNDMGYKGVSEFPAGVRFNKLPHPDQKGKFIAPYLDNFPTNLIEKGDHFVTLGSGVSNQELKGQTILARDGYGFWTASRICPKLGNAQPLTEPWTMVAGVDEEWSPQAVRSHTFKCPRTKRIWPAEDKFRVVVGGQMYARSIADELGVFRCDVTKMDYLKDDLHAEVDGKKISKAGHVFLERQKRIIEERKRERERVEKQKTEWMTEMALVAESADEALGVKKEPSEARNHHVVMAGAVGKAKRYTSVFSGHGGVINEGHNNEERAA